MLLQSLDESLAILALECMTSLAMAPFIHRSLELNGHTTAIHKNPSMCVPLFQIVESGFAKVSVGVAEYLGNNSHNRSENDNFQFVMSNRRSYGHVQT